VVAVVRKEEAALFDEDLEPLALCAAEPNELVPRHEEERKREQLRRIGGDDDFFGIDRNGGVLDE
jgi:hypothetical protein